MGENSAITSKNYLSLCKNATIQTTGTQTYDALSNYDLQNKVHGEGGSLLLSLHWADSDNYITANENINVGEGALLKNEGGLYEDSGITLAAHDNLKFNFRAKGYAQAGVAGYVGVETLTDLKRNSTITINGTLNSAKDLNLYAGADTNGEGSKVNSYSESVTESNTVIPASSVKVSRSGKTTSNVNINSGAYGEAKHDVNIISNAGYETYDDHAFAGTLWGKGEHKDNVSMTELGNVTGNSYTHSKNVKVDGSLKAGSVPNATIKISGVAVPDDFLLVDKNAKNLSYSVTSGNETVTKKNTNFKDMTSEEAFAQYVYNGITTGMIRPEDSLIPRYKEIETNVNEYGVNGRNDIVAYNSLLQEKKSLEEELEKLSLGRYTESGEFLLDPDFSVGIKTLVLPNVEVSGGSINVRTGSFSGSGKLNASGVPQIDIENDSTAYLVANKLTIADKGGNVIFNGKTVASNSDIGGDAKFAEIKVANSKEIPTIKVSNNYSGSGPISVKVDPKAEGYSKLPDEVKKEGTKYTPLNYIEIIGDVTNPVGKAFISNTHGSIKISTGATVNAMDIEMRAGDSITQGYTDSIVNIAYNPEYAYADEAKKLRKAVGWDRDWQFTIGNETDILKHLQSDKIETKTSDWKYTGGSPWKAGKAIYISARDININGLIQAGYSDFAVNITQADLDNATETTFFNDTLMYKVNDGGEKLNSKGYYVYEPQVYYDKANNKLYVDNIDSSSGKIYLAGRISSTGNGRIIANDGLSNINITNNSSADMSVGKVTSNEGEGFIQIVDSAQDKLTEYSSGKTRTIENYSKWLVENKKGKLTESKVTEDKGLSIGQFVEYNPKSGLTYNWTEGAEQHEKVSYTYLVETTWWGAKGDSEYDECKKDLKKLAEEVIPKYLNKRGRKASRFSQTGDTKFVDLGIGKFIADGSDTGNETDADVKSLGDLIGKYTYLFNQNKDSKDDTVKDVNLIVIAQNVVMENGYQIETWKGPFYSGAKFFKDWELDFYKSTGTKQIYTYSLKADYPISVGIIGKSNPSINLANTSNKGGDLYLRGDIRNDKGTLNISAKSGSIIQDAGVKISTDNINLSALNDIKNIDIVNHRTDDLKLNAKSTSNEGKISVNVTGGIHNNQNLKGAVVVDTLNSKYGEVQLTAQGDIKQTIDDAPINARNIKLESTDGAINLKIKSDAQSGAELSAISAAAKGDIKLTKTDNDDFLIGSIVSTSGDVELKANGKFVDALDKARDNSDMQKSELIKSWIDMGLIAGTDDYKGAYLNRLEQDRDNYKADVTELFKEYQALLVAYQKQLDEYNSFEDKSVLAVYQGVTDPAEVKAPEKSDRLVLLEKKFANYDSEDAYLAADKDYQTLVATVANPQYQWTEEELLSSIRSSIVNKQTGASDDVTRLKDANITARNVTLTGAGVGSNSKETTKINMSELRVKENETAKEKSARLEKLSALANVSAADVKVNYVLEENGNPVKQTVTQVTYRHDATKGYYIDEAGNYVRYRNDADGNLLKYTYDKDLKQIGDAVKVAKDANGNYDLSDIILSTNTIENKEIESFEISGKIPVGINATGNITVNTTGKNGTYIAGRNKGVKITETTNPNKDSYSPLNINKIETSEIDNNYQDVRIVGAAGIFNAADSGENVIGKHLVLVGGNGAIGTQEKPFAVRLTGDLLDARANDEINLKSVGADNFRVSAMYSPKAIRITADENTRIEHSARYDEIDEAYIDTPGELTLIGTSGTDSSPIVVKPHEKTVLNLKDGDNFYIKGINDGTINLNDISGKVEIDTEGSIKQTATGTNTLTDIKVAANSDVILDGNNKLAAIDLGAIGGNFELKNDSDKLTANFGGTITGDAQITQRGDIALEGSVNGSTLSLASESGNITSTGGLTATKEIKLSSATFTHKGEIHTDKLTIATDNGVKIDNTENSFSALEIASRDGKAINGSIEVTIKADTFAPTIKNNVTGDVTLTNTKTGGLLSFGGGKKIKIGGTFKAETQGDFEYGSTLLTGKDIDIRAQNIYRRAGTTGYFGTTGRIEFNVDKGNQIGTADNPIMIANKAAKTDGLTLYGAAHIKGVNDGILTLGKVSSEDVSISSEGSIAQVDDKTEVISAKKITVAAAKDIVLDNANNNIETIAVNGGNNIKVTSISPKGLTVEGDLKATGDVDITSKKSLAVNGEIESEKNIALTAGTDLTSGKAGVMKSGEKITLKAEDVKLAGKVETPNLEVTINNGLKMNNDANAIKALTVKSDGEQINGTVSVTSNVEIPDEEPDNPNLDDYIFSARILNKVAGDLTLKSNGIVSLKSFSDDALLKTLEVGGNLTLDTGIGFITARPIYSDKDLNIISREGGMFVINFDSAENNETLKAAKNVKLNAADSIDIEGQITAGSGNLEINSRKDGINIFGKAQLLAGKDIDLTVGEGNINVEGSVTSNKGNVEMSIDTGNLNIEKILRAKKGTVDIAIGEGNIQIGNDTTKQKGELVLFAKRDINMKTGNGTINISGNNESASGEININTNEKTQNNSANVAEFYSYDGTPVFFSANVVENDSPADAKKPSDITIEAELKANNSISITTDDGDIEVKKKITVTNGDITIATQDGNILIDDNGSEDMVRAQNNLDIETDNGSVTISGKIATQDGDISITSNHDTYKAGQKGITVDETGAINPGRNLYLNATNGDIEFKKATAENAEIKTINGSVTADTLKADDTIHIELEHGDLYLNLAQSKGVAILTGDSKKSSVNTIKSDSVTVDRNLVTVGQLIPYKSTPKPSKGTSTTRSTASSYGFGNSYSNNFASSNFASNRSSAATLRSSSATLGSTLTNLTTTYWQEATSKAPADYSFGEFNSTTNDVSYMLTRNYFEVRFVPTWLEKEFMVIDFDYSFDNFGIKNATENELTID